MRTLTLRAAIIVAALFTSGCGILRPLHDNDRDLHVVPLPSRYVFPLPDLQVASIDCRDRQGSLLVRVIVHNGGTRDAGAFDIAVDVLGQSGNAPPNQRFTGTLAPGADTPRYGFYFQGASTPGTFTVIATVDPPTPSAPFGEVFESDESNNASRLTCTV